MSVRWPDAQAGGDPTVVEAAGVVTSGERRLAVAHWLLSAADDRDETRAGWASGEGVGLLRCGGIFAAVRAPGGLVRVAFGFMSVDEADEVDDRLRRWFDSGAVFMDRYFDVYYFLVPPSAVQAQLAGEYPGVGCLGRDHYLGVPAPRFTERRGRSYWCIPLEYPGDLCYPDEVWQLLQRGQAAKAEEPRCVR